MTELEIRDSVIMLCARYLGCKTGDSLQKEIVDIYNSHQPLPRGYRVKYTDKWCATFVSSIAIMQNFADIIPIECGCGEQVAIAKSMGIWHDRNFTPRKGDIIMYDWKSKKDGYADHTGYIENVADGFVETIEGNMSGGICGRRKIEFTDGEILGFITPDYASKETRPVIPDEKVMYAESFDKSIAGEYTVTTGLYLRRGAGTRYGIVKVMPKGAKVRNYGYYTMLNKVPWYYVKFDNYVGFCSSKYLKRVM